jgi:beta-1,4-mannosyl-glycoprotein beta-1,4-N-acetylglucosaminyltransferase
MPGLVDVIIPDAGWHFSYMGGIEAIQQKVRAGSHFRECGTSEFMDEGHLAQAMTTGADLFNRSGHNVTTVPLDERFPKYVVDNKDKFKRYIKEV